MEVLLFQYFSFRRKFLFFFFVRFYLHRNLFHLCLKLKALNSLFIIEHNTYFLFIRSIFLTNERTKYLLNIYYIKI